LKRLGTPCLIHQPSYSMINRWVEADGLLDTLDEEGIGSIAFTPLAQGMLTSKYLKGVPEQSRAAAGKSLDPGMLSDDNLRKVQGLNAIAERRGQSLAQLALAWVLRNGRVTSALIGASRPEQVIECIGAVKNLDFSEGELHEIDQFATEGSVNLWARSAELK
jgi:L-glyceraldehyde 3-phosphate reductase